jgi:hypothetical protein
MKRPVITALFLCVVAGLAGCPIYDHSNSGCYTNSDCGASFVCNQSTGVCEGAFSCTKPEDCGANTTCTPSGQCRPGDCSFYNGCVAGYRCDSSGIWQCVADDAGVPGAGGASEAAAGAGGAAEAGSSAVLATEAGAGGASGAGGAT